AANDISLTAAVTTRPLARSAARMPQARSICAMTQPPKISPAALVSAGMASVLSVSSPIGSTLSPGMGVVLVERQVPHAADPATSQGLVACFPVAFSTGDAGTPHDAPMPAGLASASFAGEPAA